MIWDLATVGFIMLKQGYYLGKTLFGYLCMAYARFVLAVEGLTRSYARLKSRIQGKAAGGGKRAVAGDGAAGASGGGKPSVEA